MFVRRNIFLEMFQNEVLSEILDLRGEVSRSLYEYDGKLHD
jgi:hypothetical protein